MVLFFAVLLFAPVSTAVAVESADSYYSWHQNPVEGPHCTPEPCTTGENCQISADCPSAKPYLRNVTRIGYQSINDVRDDYYDIGETYSLPAVSYRNGAGISIARGIRSKIFIPEGARKLDLTIYCTQDPIAMVVRWKQPPDASYTEQINTFYQYSSFSHFSQEGTYTLDEMAARDIYLQNPGGTIQIHYGQINATTAGPTPVTEGGWLYIYTFYYDSNFINTPLVRIYGAIDVVSDIFFAWYDECTAGGCWDGTGDPVVSSSSSTCANNPALCTAEIQCTNNGWNWCDGTCQAAACPTCADNPELCATSTECANAGWNWCQDSATCQAAACPTCADDPALCSTSDECTAAGWNWCGNGTCQTDVCLTCADDPAMCASLGECIISGWIWDAGECVGTCAQNAAQCTTEADCANNGWNWCNGVCQESVCSTACSDYIATYVWDSGQMVLTLPGANTWLIDNVPTWLKLYQLSTQATDNSLWFTLINVQGIGWDQIENTETCASYFASYDYESGQRVLTVPVADIGLASDLKVWLKLVEQSGMASDDILYFTINTGYENGWGLGLPE